MRCSSWLSVYGLNHRRRHDTSENWFVRSSRNLREPRNTRPFCFYALCKVMISRSEYGFLIRVGTPTLLEGGLNAAWTLLVRMATVARHEESRAVVVRIRRDLPSVLKAARVAQSFR